MDASDPPDATVSDTVAADVSLADIPLHSTNLLTVLDEEGVIQYESPSIERIFGFDQETLIGEEVTEFFHPDDRGEVADAFRTLVESNAYVVESVEYRHRTVDGSYIWVESVASSEPTPEGYYVVNSRDITARKEREQELEATNEHLEDFASVVSHDLRSPLSVAQGRLALAAEDCDSPHLEDAQDALTRMESLITELLKLSRVGQSITEPDRVDLADLCDSCWRTLATEDAALEVDGTQVFHADTSSLQQLFENLFRNAVDHAGPDVTVTVGPLDSGFYVEDDGPGIDPERRDTVFDVGASDSRDGLGLGLSIVERVVDAHDWEVSIETGTTGGARFEITAVDVLE